MISLTAGSGSLWLTSESPLSSPVTNLFQLLEHCFLLQRSTLCVTRVTHWFSSILYRYKIQNSFPSEIIIIWLKATMQTLFVAGQEWSLRYAFEPELPSKIMHIKILKTLYSSLKITSEKLPRPSRLWISEKPPQIWIVTLLLYCGSSHLRSDGLISGPKASKGWMPNKGAELLLHLYKNI